MYRIILLVIAAAGLLFTLAGCAGKGDQTGTGSSADATATAVETPASANTAPPELAPAARVEPPPATPPKPAAPAARTPPPAATPPAAVAPAPTPVAERPYYPFGKEGAAVIIRPVGEAFISLVNGKIDTADGKPIPVVEGDSKGYYDRVAMPPGKVRLRIGSVSAPTEAEIGFDATAGVYVARSLIYTQDGGSMWTPVVTRGNADGPIVAARGGIIVGLTPDKAIRLLSASDQDLDKVLGEIRQESKGELIERANAHFAAGRRHFRDKRVEQSLKEFSTAIEIAPGFDSAHVYQGMALLRLKRPQEALSSFDNAIKAAIKRRGANAEWLSWPHFQKGRALMDLEKIDLALAELGESIRLKPSASVLATRGNIYFVQGQLQRQAGDTEAARQLFLAADADVDRGLSLKGDNVQLWAMKSGVHFMLGETPQACKAARKACELGNCAIVKDFPECKKGGS